ncbi:amidase family protein [Nocardia sp. NBC_00508]|uniref:amidase family protein n=1 Tax=Nocardia sp. NBC_00508 TaxID=2975992 RepID=UPI002E81C839|nr:amidase family protein [Nocardia sp. NBC_00508]WUD66232.1 amidase family protein [Nocardia sp. NBC_00508]
MTSATVLAAALAAQHTTPTELADAAVGLAREPRAATTMITVSAERAWSDAKTSAARHRRGEPRSRLDGIPIAWKDVFDIPGVVTTCGSSAHVHDAPARAAGHLVRRAAESGLITIGKTNLSEFAFSGLGVNHHFGTPPNPLDAGLVPGGSSSGSAVAVATGIVPLAVGTDTSGSVRIPAAFCGIIGYRASPGRYGPHDFAPLAPTLDSIGTFATTVEDIIALDQTLTRCRAPHPSGPPRFVIPAGEWSEDSTPGIARDFSGLVAELGAAGADIVSRALPSMSIAQDLMDRNGTIVGAEAFQLHRRRLGSTIPAEAATLRRLASNAHTGATVHRVYDAMRGLRRAFAAELDGATLLCPTVRHPPPAIADLDSDDIHYDRVNASTLRTTMLLSYLGTCGITLPTPASGPGPRSGALLSRPYGQDHDLLADAAWTHRMCHHVRRSAEVR